MGILDFLANDPGSQQGGLFGTMGPLSGSQKTALLFSGLRDALADYQGRPAGNMDALTQQFRADQMRRGYLNTLGTLSAPSQPNEVNVTPQVQPTPGGGTNFDPNNPAYSQPAMSQAGPLAGDPRSDLLKTLPPEQGIPALMSMMAPHGFDVVQGADGAHKIDKVTGEDLGLIGQPKIQTFDPSKINFVPNAILGNSGGQSPTAPMNAGQRNLANNNPGNLRVPGKMAFQSFPNMEAGVNAVTNQLGLYGKRGLNTVASIISTYAPPSENDTASYVAGVSKDLGVDPSAPLNMQDPHVLTALTQSILKHEQGGSPVVQQAAQPASDVPNIPGYTTFAPKPDWRTITDPAEAKALNVNVGSQINTSTNEVKPLSAYNMPASAEDPSIKMYGAILATTGHLPTGAGRDASSMRAYRTAAYNYLKGQGLSDEQIAQKIPANAIGYKAQGSAASTMAKTNAATAVNEGTVNNSINIVRTLLPFAASKGSFTDVNSFMQALGRKTNDPNAVMLKNGIDSISAEYARVMTGATNGTASSDASRKEAADRILTGYNNGTLNAVMNQMQLEMAGRSGSQSSVLKNLSNGSYSGVPVPYSPKKPPPLSPVSPSNLPRKATILQRVNSVSDAMKLAPGTHFLDPHGVERVR